jgi:hypothetical protein
MIATLDVVKLAQEAEQNGPKLQPTGKDVLIPAGKRLKYATICLAILFTIAAAFFAARPLWRVFRAIASDVPFK